MRRLNTEEVIERFAREDFRVASALEIWAEQRLSSGASEVANQALIARLAYLLECLDTTPVEREVS